jgi:serine protease Do
VENITQQLGDFFGVKDGKGVLVRSVEKGSRGEKSGFRAGDVIVKVNSEPVHDSSDFTHALRSSSGSSAAVTVMREKREQTLTLSLPEKDSGAVIEESLGDSDWTAETVEAVNRAGDEMAAIAPVMSEVIAETDCWKEAQEKVKEAQQELEEKQQELQQEEQEREQELQEQQKEQQEQEKDMQEHRLQRQQEIEQEQQERQQEIIEQQKELQEQQQELQERVREGLAKQLADI